MDLIEIDMIRLQSAQAGIDRVHNVSARCAHIVAPGPTRPNTLVARTTSFRAIFEILEGLPEIFSLSPSE